MGGDTPEETPVAIGLDADGFPIDKDNNRLPGAVAIPSNRRQEFLDGLKKTPAAFRATSGDEAFVRDPSTSTDGSDPDVERRRRINLWDAVKNRIPAGTEVSGFAKNLLSDLSAVQNASGMLTVFNNGGDTPIFDITRGGTVGLRKNWDLTNTAQLTSADHIDALLKGAAAAKMTSGAAGANVASPNENSQAMMEKAAQLAGLKIVNPKFLKYNADGTTDSTALDAKLETIEPGLAAKMNKQSADIRTKYGIEEYQVVPTIQPRDMIPDPPKTATELTNANAQAESAKPGIPTVLLIYDPANPGSSLSELDRLAAMGGDKVNVVKMDINLLKNDDPNNPATLGFSVREPGADGKSFVSPTVPATAEDMIKWIEGDNGLKAKVFPETPATAPVAAPNTATELTAATAAAAVASTLPTVLMLYDPGDPTQQAKMDQLAAAAGGKVNILKLDINQADALKAQLPADSPMRQVLEEGNSGLTVFDATGQSVEGRQAIPGTVDEIKAWVENALNSETPVFPQATTTQAVDPTLRPSGP